MEGKVPVGPLSSMLPVVDQVVTVQCRAAFCQTLKKIGFVQVLGDGSSVIQVQCKPREPCAHLVLSGKITVAFYPLRSIDVLNILNTVELLGRETTLLIILILWTIQYVFGHRQTLCHPNYQPITIEVCYSWELYLLLPGCAL